MGKRGVNLLFGFSENNGLQLVFVTVYEILLRDIARECMLAYKGAKPVKENVFFRRIITIIDVYSRRIKKSRRVRRSIRRRLFLQTQRNL